MLRGVLLHSPTGPALLRASAGEKRAAGAGAKAPAAATAAATHTARSVRVAAIPNLAARPLAPRFKAPRGRARTTVNSLATPTNRIEDTLFCLRRSQRYRFPPGGRNITWCIRANQPSCHRSWHVTSPRLPTRPTASALIRPTTCVLPPRRPPALFTFPPFGGVTLARTHWGAGPVATSCLLLTGLQPRPPIRPGQSNASKWGESKECKVVMVARVQ